MAAFTVTKAPGFCMAGERLCIAEGRRKKEVRQRIRKGGCNGCNGCNGCQEEGRSNKINRFSH